MSPSTFFRYFPTKEDVVLQDDMELLWIDALRAQPPDLPPIEVYGSELNQVWTNLLANAIEAMDGTGSLDITARAAPGGAALRTSTASFSPCVGGCSGYACPPDISRPCGE